VKTIWKLLKKNTVVCAYHINQDGSIDRRTKHKDFYVGTTIFEVSKKGKELTLKHSGTIHQYVPVTG
jgi:hypothetical protein